MGTTILLSPPAVFIIVLLAALCFAMMLSRLAYKPKYPSKSLNKAYSCGEEIPSHMMQPDYSQFFPFIFYFTMLHVVALMVATMPVAKIETSVIAVVYILGAIIGLFVLYRR
jgi:NADH:ubiquinone oxidoreductase subunit 3 (subunit A)